MLVAQFSISLIQWIQRSHHSLRSFVLPFTAYSRKVDWVSERNYYFNPLGFLSLYCIRMGFTILPERIFRG